MEKESRQARNPGHIQVVQVDWETPEVRERGSKGSEIFSLSRVRLVDKKVLTCSEDSATTAFSI